jgi:hypothetical protein
MLRIEVEQFRPLPSNPDYLISDKGRVYSKKSNKFLSGSPAGAGYLSLYIYDNGERKMHYIHRLVMETFVGTRPNNFDTNHIDGDKKNNCLYNLEYCSKSNNQKHAFRLGLNKPNVMTGEKNGNCKLTDVQVKEVRVHIESGRFLLRELGKKYNVHPSLIRKIKQGYRKPI